MVEVSSSVYRELIATIMGSGEVNMYDVRAILEYAQEHGFVAVSRLIQADPSLYLECINEGIHCRCLEQRAFGKQGSAELEAVKRESQLSRCV